MGKFTQGNQMSKGRGRPKSVATIEREKTAVMSGKIREKLVTAVQKNLPAILDGQIALAKGVKMTKRQRVYNPDSKKMEWVDALYLVAPSESAAKNLLEQSIGKPAQQLDATVSFRTPLQLVTALENDEDES